MAYGAGVGAGCAPVGGAGLWTSTGAILVLFILLVIISRAFVI
ncbi:YjcZ family sporulation protein [Paenibacillus tarimensis]|nr:YjcZ family sporulation protein [Paenibacillus tarimensis]MCF2945716.1 YjcZ family sporulation protein [Paenibacillus tarimensis]